MTIQYINYKLDKIQETIDDFVERLKDEVQELEDKIQQLYNKANKEGRTLTDKEEQKESSLNYKIYNINNLIMNLDIAFEGFMIEE